ncbi:family 10 glycosylhydrolase [Escherichia coli]
MRGIWLATVSRLNWPPVSSVNISNPTSRARVQQQAMIDKLDHLQRLGITWSFSRSSRTVPPVAIENFAVVRSYDRKIGEIRVTIRCNLCSTKPQAWEMKYTPV